MYKNEVTDATMRLLREQGGNCSEELKLKLIDMTNARQLHEVLHSNTTLISSDRTFMKRVAKEIESRKDKI